MHLPEFNAYCEDQNVETHVSSEDLPASQQLLKESTEGEQNSRANWTIGHPAMWSQMRQSRYGAKIVQRGAVGPEQWHLLDRPFICQALQTIPFTVRECLVSEGRL